jgi:hypothetical protein
MTAPQPYRKKPVVIQAKQFESLEIWRATTAQPWHQIVCDRDDVPTIVKVLHVHTLEGFHEVTPGDWIIQGVKGEFYPCKPDIFELTYEPVYEEIGSAGPVPLGPEPTSIDVPLTKPLGPIAPPRPKHDRPVG